jgi:hypothetical protein
MFIGRYRLVLLALCVTYMPFVYSQSTFTQGAMTVSGNGTFEYSIPLKLPAARNGMLPQLSLNFNSRAGNGPFGIGWSVGGLSMITRCPKTLAQDGVVEDIKFIASDAYCLDGKRLIPINGVNGADKTEYRTESDEFAKITSSSSYDAGYGPSGPLGSGGPLLFKVKTRSGLSLVYGSNATNTANVLKMGNATPGQNNPIRGWAIDSITDQFGNQILFYYTNVSVENQQRVTPIDDGVFYLTSINYNWDDASSIPIRGSIYFRYGERKEGPVKYQAGYALPHPDKALTTVETWGYQDDNHVRFSNYEMFTLEEGQSINGYPRRVAEIAECLSYCRVPLELTWESRTQPTFNLSSSTVSFPGTRLDYEDFFVDLNGAGKKSWIRISRGSDEAWIGTANANGTFTTDKWTRVSQSVGTATQYAYYFADVDGDGKADWIRVNRTTPDAWVALGSGNGAFQAWVKVTMPVGAANTTTHYFADINGDGRADWIQNGPIGTNQAWIVAVGLASGGSNFQSVNTGISGQFSQAWIADVNGDGLTDILTISNINSSNGIVVSYISKGDGTFRSYGAGSVFGPVSGYGQTAPVDMKYYVGDFNGDLNADILGITSSGAVWLAYGKGNGAFDTPSYIYDTSATNRQILADLDGDGMVDWISLPVNAASGSTLAVYPSNGAAGDYSHAASSSNFTMTLPGASSSNANQIYLTDLNGDGKADLIAVSSTGQLWAAMSQAVFSGKLISIGPKGYTKTDIRYKPISDSTVYTPDANAVYPMRDAVFPAKYQQKMPMLVSSIITQNGIGGTLTTNYTYVGAKTDLRSRGFLGMRVRNATQLETGITVTDEYRQDFPFTGLKISSKTTIASGGNGGMLSRSDYTYGCNDFVNGACAAAPGKRYFPYLKSVSTSTWDLNGAVLPVTSTSYAYDDFGNVTQLINETVGVYKEQTDTVYSNDTTKWWLGKPTKVTVTKTTP